jgi:hypothetical protein
MSQEGAPTITYEGPRVDLIGCPETARMLDCSLTHVYKLMGTGLLTEYPWVQSRQRMLTLKSVRAYQHAAAVAAVSEGV